MPELQEECSRIVFCIIAAAGMLCSCTGADDSTPRRRGYPRLPLYDSCYARVDGAALHMEANCGADVTTDSAGRWITVRYPCMMPLCMSQSHRQPLPKHCRPLSTTAANASG